MSTKLYEDLRLPVGRMVMGDLYKPRTTDADKKPLLIKNGPRAGQPRVDYFLAVAIPKVAGHTSWTQTEWGAKIYQFGSLVAPQFVARQDFAWKITDGDSQAPNKKGKKPCDNNGFPGHWVLFMGNGSAPQLCNANGSQMLTEPGVIKCGHYVQVLLTLSFNNSESNPGMYLSEKIVAHSGYGAEISHSPDPSAVGFGADPAPAGMSTMPVGMPPVTVAAAVTPPATMPGKVPPPAPPVSMPPPHTAILRVMTAKAAGATYDQFKASGWTDDALIAQGYMVGG